MKNIDMFNLTVSEILGQCYKNFPNETDFDYRQVAHQVSQYYDESDYQENCIMLEGICRDTMSWLYQADYLWTRYPVHSERATSRGCGQRYGQFELQRENKHQWWQVVYLIGVSW